MINKKKILAKVISTFYDTVLKKYVEPETVCELDEKDFDRLSKSKCVVPADSKSSGKPKTPKAGEVNTGESEEESEDEESEESEEDSEEPTDANKNKNKLGKNK